MTQKKIRYISNHLQYSNRLIAQKLDLTEAQVRNYLHKQGIRRTPDQLEQIRQRIAVNQTGENNGNYKNGISTNFYHYKKIQVERYPERIRARARVYYHKKQNNITPGTCEICGTEKSIEAHHPDYEQPLELIWLCSVHHRELHQKEREQVGIISGTVST
jgi:hypothetical protein